MANNIEISPEESYKVAQDLAASARYEDAIAAYSSTIDRDPNHVKAWVGRGLARQRTGEHDKAIADFDIAISRFSDWQGSCFAYYSRAVSRHALAQLSTVIEDCDEAIKRMPSYADALYLRGSTHLALEQLEVALNDMDAAIEADPNFSEAYLVRGRLHYMQQHWTQAIDDLNVAMQNATERTEIARECLYLRGLVAQELGNHKAAIADLTQAIELAPDDGSGYLRRSRSFHEIGEFALADADVQAAMIRMKTAQ